MASRQDHRTLDFDPPALKPAPRASRFLAWSAAAILVVAALGAALLITAVEERRGHLHAALEARLQALAQGRAEVLSTWLAGIAELGSRLTGSELVQLFASEMALSEPQGPLPEWLDDQMPYMQQLIDDFVAQHDLLGAALIGRDGRVFVASRDAAIGDQVTRAALFLENHPADERQFTRVRAVAKPEGGQDLVLDVMLPVPEPQPLATSPDVQAAGALLLAVPVAERVAELLRNPPVLGALSRARLIQAGAAGPEEIVPPPDARVVPLAPDFPVSPGEAKAYGPMSGRAGGHVLAVGAPVPGLPWTVLQGLDADEALAPLGAFTRTAVGLGAISGLSLVLAFAAFWWRQSSAHHRELALQYRDLADRIQRQRQLLESITNTIREMITLKGADGRYQYVNPAAASAFGREPEKLVGHTDADLYPPSAATLLARSDRSVLAGKHVAAQVLEVELAHGRRALSVSKIPLQDETGRVLGIIAVARDETELVEQRRRRERLLHQTVDSLVRAIELRDPFLLGHSERLRHYALAVGRALGLGADDLTTLEIAARLSQIGKLFIPDHILAKPGRHTGEESAAMRRHIEHARAILAPIDFGLPVTDVVSQMYERLDGTGYPQGLAGEQVGLLARILGAGDVFCARTAARSYRDQVSPGQALYHLAENPHRFDVKVISALAAVVAAEGRAGDPAMRTPSAARGSARPNQDVTSPTEAAA